MAVFRIINQVRKLTIHNNILLNTYCQRNYLASKILNDAVSTEAEKKKKTIPIPKITLISPDESIQIVSLPEAQKLSVRRNLKLVKIVDLDTKTQRPIFKLMTGADYLAKDLKQREAKKADKKSGNSLKGEKLLLLTSRITEHDLDSRIKKILKWIDKKHEVRVTISGDAENMDACESVYKNMEDKLKTFSRIVQKRTKGSELKFQIIPPKVAKDEGTATNLENNL